MIYCPWTNSLTVSTNASPEADSSVEQYSKCSILTTLFTLLDLFKVKENKLGFCVHALMLHEKKVSEKESGDEQNNFPMGKESETYKTHKF